MHTTTHKYVPAFPKSSLRKRPILIWKLLYYLIRSTKFVSNQVLLNLQVGNFIVNQNVNCHGLHQDFILAFYQPMYFEQQNIILFPCPLISYCDYFWILPSDDLINYTLGVNCLLQNWRFCGLTSYLVFVNFLFFIVMVFSLVYSNLKGSEINALWFCQLYFL